MTDAKDRHATRSPEGGRAIHLLGRTIRLPRSRALRIAIGVVLVILGIFGFLPILGFWMIPLGLLVLSYEFATVRRWRRKLEVSWGRWRNGRA
ncbi:PGPGW domain-containing protein [Mesorhizobium koreense]|jgi:hypothetical protein|uniref:PGPGW domain-containing protein n=1 Tax=Mesorhizobium koreense TaxID=3074855 RepID=UPI00287BC4AA|nr:PGPGW domain-containing protein [Mesorhizobium sp. WR6]